MRLTTAPPHEVEDLDRRMSAQTHATASAPVDLSGTP